MKIKIRRLRRYAQTMVPRARLLMLSGCCLLLAYTSHGQQSGLKEKVKLNVAQSTLSKVLDELDRQSSYSFSYMKEDFNAITISNYIVNNITLSEALNQLKLKTGIEFTINGNSVLFRKAIPVSIPKKDPGHISGKITDERGDPLTGATIQISGNHHLTTNSAADGSYSLTLKPGNYTLEVSFISYQPQRITDIEVKSNNNTPLNILMKAQTGTLSQVVVTSGYKKASVNALYAEQKNRASISNGISAEQIAATPDRNVGEVLKRISGVNAADNKFVIVRGIGERYNAAMLDGTALPSTEAQKRSFSFDMIPNALVDNVVVVKTVTPDMNMSFGGGAIQINTKDIPSENFMTIGIGTSFNDLSTGKEFLSRKRGSKDYLGFDDGKRSFPAGLKAMSNDAPREEIVDQSKRFANRDFSVYKYTASPSQNYQFSIGRLFRLGDGNQRKFGFTGALSYRNNQTINDIEEMRRGRWNTNSNIPAVGKSYNFNTTLGAVLNMGLQLGKHRISLRNTYTHLFDNTFTQLKGVDADDYLAGKPNQIREADDPTFTTLIQHKLMGQHKLGKIRLDWDLARTSINRAQKDIGIATKAANVIGKDTFFFYVPSQLSEPKFTPISRHSYSNSETHYSWNLSASRQFDFGKFKNTVKAGYFGTERQARFSWQILPVVAVLQDLDPALVNLPISDWLKPENIRADGYMLLLDGWGNDYYSGKSQNHAGYLMLDHKFNRHWRLVWGLRAEYFNYKEIRNASNAPKEGANGNFDLAADKKWQWLPSANLTYSPVNSLNLRVAYSSTVVRPEMMDNSQFFRYSAFYEGLVGSAGINSTRITSYDFKAEWFPGPGELLSIGGFYKYFDKPAEMIAMETLDFGFRYTLQNSNWAKVYGLELEARKSLGFIADIALLQHLTAYGNLSLQQSKVEGLYPTGKDDPATGKPIKAAMSQTRALYGQAPYLLNAGLQYQDEKLGLNIVYNKSGRKTYFVTTAPSNTEYEQPREQLDAQISYKFIKSGLELRLSAANILNAASIFYNNRGSYEANPDNQGQGDASNALRLKKGFTDNYEAGDLYTFRQRFGRSFSVSLTYKF